MEDRHVRISRDGALDTLDLAGKDAHCHAWRHLRDRDLPKFNQLHALFLLLLVRLRRALCHGLARTRPQHLYPRHHHLSCGRQVDPNLEQLLVGTVGRRTCSPHLLVLQTTTSGHPLHGAAFAGAIRALRRAVGFLQAVGVAVHNSTPQNVRHRFETAVRMCGKALRKQDRPEHIAERVQESEGVPVVGHEQEWIGHLRVIPNHRAHPATKAVFKPGPGFRAASDEVEEYVHDAEPCRPYWQPNVLDEVLDVGRHCGTGSQ
mmetsp:Transcript_42770/g.118115  ORF Transcript_42770/g.118115 Transcript_42770/m.118115 type:complete len:261 (-) Transcript_42770:259-1041(-)